MKEEIEFLKNSIGKELRKKRADLNLTKTDVIKRICEHGQKYDIATLSRYENGETLQSLDKLCILLSFYNTDLRTFFNQIYENFHRNKLSEELNYYAEELEKEKI